jgi:UDP-N-acetylmuramoylalanine--D-glutamate ligase
MEKLSPEALLGSSVHVVGVSGTEGAAVARWLISLGHRSLVGHDFKTAAEFEESFGRYHAHLSRAESARALRELRAGLAKLHLRGTYLAGVGEADVIIVPSSWFRYAPNHPTLSRLARGRQSVVHNLYTLTLALYRGRTVGITGTSGKGTTVALVAAMLPGCLSVGGAWQDYDVAKILRHGQRGGTLVMEVNNRQLTLTDRVKLSPDVAAVTNVTVNHLDDHGGSFTEYRRAKWQILAHQRRSGVAVLNADEPYGRSFSRRARGRVRLFGLAARPDLDATVREGWVTLRRGRQWQRVALVKSLPLQLRGPHLLRDALAAALCAEACGAGPRAIARALWGFRGLPGRQEVLRTARGITYVNDTASTRPEATVAAVETYTGRPIHLIMGGSRQKPNERQYAAALKALAHAGVRTVALIGSLAPWLERVASRSGLPADVAVVSCRNLAGALATCRRRAAADGVGGTVLLSPGCESFGEFIDYRERGRRFAEMVEAL